VWKLGLCLYFFVNLFQLQALDDFDDVTRRKARPPKSAASANKKLGANSTLGGK
jgi:hypothetical protein